MYKRGSNKALYVEVTLQGDRRNVFLLQVQWT